MSEAAVPTTICWEHEQSFCWVPTEHGLRYETRILLVLRWSEFSLVCFLPIVSTEGNAAYETSKSTVEALSYVAHLLLQRLAVDFLRTESRKDEREYGQQAGEEVGEEAGD